MSDSSTRQPVKAQHIRTATNRKSVGAWGPVLALVIVPAASLLLGIGIVKAYNRLAWMLAEIHGTVGWFGWLLMLPLAAWFIYEVIARVNDGKQAVHKGAKPEGRAMVACIATVAIVIAGNGCLNIAASRVESFYLQRKKYTTDIYTNHDLAKLSGQCIRLAMLRHAERLSEDSDRKALVEIAGNVPGKWQQLVAANDSRVIALTNVQLTQFIREPDAPALNKDLWAAFLQEWRQEADLTRPEDSIINDAAATIAADFGITLREALKADFESGGKAWAAMQLDIAQQLLNRTPMSLATANPQINTALIEVKVLLTDDAKGLPALHRTVLDVKQSQEAHAKSVATNFDQVVGMLARIQADVTAIKAVTTETNADVKESKVDIDKIRSSLEINDWIKRIEVDPNLTPAQRQAQTTALLDRKQALRVPGETSEPTPADVQDIVKDIFKGAPKVVRFAALARVGLDKEADELAAEIERTTSGLSDSDKYEYFVAKGDRYWNTNDFWNAATWYAQAMGLRVDDQAVVYRAAQSTIRTPAKSTFIKDLQLAQSWVERCLAKLSYDQRHNSDNSSKLLATLATTQILVGRTREAVESARESIQYLNERAIERSPREPMTPSTESMDMEETLAALVVEGVVMMLQDMNARSRATIRMEAAMALSSAGQFEEALAAADLAMKDVRGFEELTSTSSASVAFGRAVILQSCGELAQAEQEMSRCIVWSQSQSQRDEYTLANWYADRARVNRDRKMYTQALADIERSLAWAKTQKSRNNWSTALWSGDRATVLVEINRVPEAITDIATCVAWHRQQQPDNKRPLARFLRDQARIFAAAARQSGNEDQWTKASAAIQESIPLHEATFGEDHEWTIRARAWQTAIAKQEVPPRWLDTTP